jgi:hypothetical protein
MAAVTLAAASDIDGVFNRGTAFLPDSAVVLHRALTGSFAVPSVTGLHLCLSAITGIRGPAGLRSAQHSAALPRKSTAYSDGRKRIGQPAVCPGDNIRCTARNTAGVGLVNNGNDEKASAPNGRTYGSLREGASS